LAPRQRLPALADPHRPAGSPGPGALEVTTADRQESACSCRNRPRRHYGLTPASATSLGDELS
jgi:hypothetical protein